MSICGARGSGTCPLTSCTSSCVRTEAHEHDSHMPRIKKLYDAELPRVEVETSSPMGVTQADTN